MRDPCNLCPDKDSCAIKEVILFIKSLCIKKFHGNLIIPFKDGKFGKIKKEEIIDLKKKIV